MSILRQVLTEKPKVLFLNCHGDFYRDQYSSSSIKTYLCFESQEVPTLLHKFDVDNLR